MHLSLFHPLGTLSHRVNEGGLKKKEKIQQLVQLKEKIEFKKERMKATLLS
jgi:hypothetical protein